MRFQKGISGNPGGRPIGSKNKSTVKLAGLITSIIENNAERLQRDIEYLEPKDRVRIITSLLNYVLPKKQSITPLVDDEAHEADSQFTVVNSRDELQELNQAQIELDQARAEFECDKQKWLIEHGYI